MAIATSGLTAAPCVIALQSHGLKPRDCDVLMSGATDGISSVVVRFLAGLGYLVTAAMSGPHEAEFPKTLGATEPMARDALAALGKPLQRRGCAVVNVDR